MSLLPRWWIGTLGGRRHARRLGLTLGDDLVFLWGGDERRGGGALGGISP